MLSRLVVTVAAAALTTACAAPSPGPLFEAFGGPQPAIAACMPLGPTASQTGLAGIVPFPEGTLPETITVTGIDGQIPEGVTVELVGILEPNEADELAPQTSFFSGSVKRHLSGFEVVDLPGSVEAGASGLMVAGVFTATDDLATDALHPVEVRALTYEVDGRSYALPLIRRYDIVLADAGTVSETHPDCAQHIETS